MAAFTPLPMTAVGSFVIVESRRPLLRWSEVVELQRCVHVPESRVHPAHVVIVSQVTRFPSETPTGRSVPYGARVCWPLALSTMRPSISSWSSVETYAGVLSTVTRSVAGPVVVHRVTGSLSEMS